MLGLAEGGLFLLGLWAFGFVGRCSYCYFDDVADMEWYEALLVTGAFLLIVAAAGLYNRDSFLDFRVFAKRFLFASHLVLIPTVAIVGMLKAAAGLPFGWYIGILSVAMGMFFLAIFTLRVMLFWYLNVDFLKRRVVILGQGVLADAVSEYVHKEGSSHLRCVGHLAQGQSNASPVSVISLTPLPERKPDTACRSNGARLKPGARLPQRRGRDPTAWHRLARPRATALTCARAPPRPSGACWDGCRRTFRSRRPAGTAPAPARPGSASRNRSSSADRRRTRCGVACRR